MKTSYAVFCFGQRLAPIHISFRNPSDVGAALRVSRQRDAEIIPFVRSVKSILERQKAANIILISETAIFAQVQETLPLKLPAAIR